MAPDDRIVDVHYLIALAINGEGELLAKSMRVNEALRTDPVLLEFAAAVLAGEIKPKPARKLKYLTRVERWGRARFVAHQVDIEMRKLRKKRDPAKRKALTEKLCKVYGSSVDDVASFRKDDKYKGEPRPDIVRAAGIAAAKLREFSQKKRK